MADLSTGYMGLELKNPFIVGASSLTSDLNTLDRIESAGAAAVVIKSLFEEQVALEAHVLQEELTRYNDLHAEMVSVMPTLRHGGPEKHLYWVERAVRQMDIPVIASLNAVGIDTWVEYSKKLAGTGVDGIELNIYSLPLESDLHSETIEADHIDIVERVKEVVDIPVSVKLSPFYTNPVNFIRVLDATGIDGIVMFNRFMQPEIDLSDLGFMYVNDYSSPNDHRLALRFAGILSDLVQADICASGGIHSGEDAARMILAGASCIQTASALYKNGVDHIGKMEGELATFLDNKGFSNLSEAKGMLSMRRSKDPEAYSRAHYMRMLRIPVRTDL